MAAWKDRQKAGMQLATRLANLLNDQTVLVAIPRGGIPVAVPIAQSLRLDLQIVPIRRLSIPWRPENDFAYVNDKGELYVNQALAGQVRVTPVEIHRAGHKERVLLLKDLEAWGAPPLRTLQDKSVMIVDDGMHSGWAMYSAITLVRNQGARKIIACVPVAHFRARRFVSYHCDEVVSLQVEDVALFKIENYYQEFPRVSDEEIMACLSHAVDWNSNPAA